MVCSIPTAATERVRLVGEHLGEDHPTSVLRRDEEAVAAGAHRSRDRVRSRRVAGRLARMLPGHGAEVVERVEPLHETCFDALPAPALLACDECGEDAGDRLVTGADAAEGRVDEDRTRPEAECTELVHARLRRHDPFVRGDGCVRPA